MLLFKKKDLLVVLSKSGDTVQFTKPLKDILKYQYRYNYKFVMYENGAVTVADDYVINGETLTVLFGSATVSYTSEGATYTEGGGSGESGESFTLYGPYFGEMGLEAETITIEDGKALHVEFTRFVDGDDNVLSLPDGPDFPIIIPTEFGVNNDGVDAHLTISLVGFFSLIVSNSTGRNIQTTSNNFRYMFYSSVEFPIDEEG